MQTQGTNLVETLGVTLHPPQTSCHPDPGTNYVETLRVTLHANVRIRRVYFADRLYGEDELPAEYKLFLPLQ